MTTKISGFAVFSIGIGSAFIWSGLKGWSILATLSDVISGKKPSGSEMYQLTSNAQTGSVPNSIVSDALSYKGHAYKYGGFPGLNGTQPWDCSSFVNWVVGHD